MKNKTFAPIALLGVCLLASCVDTSELYDGNAYAGPDMAGNRYSYWDQKFVEPSNTIKIKHDRNGYWNGSGNYDSPATCYGISEAKTWHPDYFMDGDKELTWTEQGDGPFGADIVGGGVAEWADNTPLVGKVYGQTKKLANQHPSFRKGYLSKLYNGQIKCDGWSSYSMVLIDQSGYAASFPRELQKAPYFGFVARGASDTNDGGRGRVLAFDIKVSFYKYAADGITVQGQAFELEEVQLQANYSSEFTSFVGFTFEDVGYDPSGIIGMSMTYELKADPMNGSADFTDGAEVHTGLGLLEIMFPDSTWN